MMTETQGYHSTCSYLHPPDKDPMLWQSPGHPILGLTTGLHKDLVTQPLFASKHTCDTLDTINIVYSGSNVKCIYRCSYREKREERATARKLKNAYNLSIYCFLRLKSKSQYKKKETCLPCDLNIDLGFFLKRAMDKCKSRPFWAASWLTLTTTAPLYYISGVPWRPTSVRHVLIDRSGSRLCTCVPANEDADFTVRFAHWKPRFQIK